METESRVWNRKSWEERDSKLTRFLTFECSLCNWGLIIWLLGVGWFRSK